MKIEHKDFIGFYYDLYPTGYCEHLIKEFNRLEEGGVGANRQRSENIYKHKKDDYQIIIELSNHGLINFENQDSCDLFFEGLQKCYDDYSDKYSILKESGNIRATVMKMQRTAPGGGYHLWHAEQAPGMHANRVLTYILYLNSLDDGDGSETEFLYQRIRVKPLENLMLLWPAAYTHAHRGNPVLADKYKYIITGWFYYD